MRKALGKLRYFLKGQVSFYCRLDKYSLTLLSRLLQKLFRLKFCENCNIAYQLGITLIFKQFVMLFFLILNIITKNYFFSSIRNVQFSVSFRSSFAPVYEENIARLCIISFPDFRGNTNGQGHKTYAVQLKRLQVRFEITQFDLSRVLLKGKIC